MAADGSPIDLSFHDALFERSRVRNGAPHTGDGGGPCTVNLASLKLNFKYLTAGRVSEGADNETLLAAIAFVVDGDDFARCNLPTDGAGFELFYSLVGGHGWSRTCWSRGRWRLVAGNKEADDGKK